MIRHSTVRLPVAILVTVAGAIIAVMAGRADAAVLAAPWTVLLVIGLSGTGRQRVLASVSSDTDRVVVGDPVPVITTVVGARGSVVATCRPDAELWPAEPVMANRTGEADIEPSVEVRAAADVATPDRSTVLHCSLTAAAWGNHDVGRVELEVQEPYGLLRWSGLVHQPTRVRVHPRPIELQELLAPWFVRRSTGNHGSRTIGRGVEYADIRPFTSGDARRDINWRASARSQQLLVSQRHPDRSTDVVLLLDSFVESGNGVRTVLGLAIEAAVALAESHLSVTDRVGLIELGGLVRWVSPGTGRHQLQRLTDALLATQLYAYSAERDLTVIPPRALPPRSLVVGLSPLYDRRFVDALFALRAGGHDVAVIDCSPIPTEPVGSGARSGPTRVAFRLWQAERAVTADLLAEHGVTVGRWRVGEQLDPVLAELIRRRRGVRTAGR